MSLADEASGKSTQSRHARRPGKSAAPRSGLRSALNHWLRGKAHLLQSSSLDNLVYQREVHVSALGHMNSDSPIIAAHVIMLGLVLACASLYLVGGWLAVFLSSAGVLAAVSIGSYPWAYRRALVSLQRDRASGMLEQLYLTRLTSEEIFEGKYYGTMAPMTEAWRYVVALAALAAFSAGMEAGIVIGLLVAVAGIIAINHFGFSSAVGVLAGIRRGIRPAASNRLIALEWRLNPWPLHLGLILTYQMFIAAPLILLGLLFQTTLMSSWVMLIVVPLACIPPLSERRELLRDEVAIEFARRFRCYEQIE